MSLMHILDTESILHRRLRLSAEALIAVSTLILALSLLLALLACIPLCHTNAAHFATHGLA